MEKVGKKRSGEKVLGMFAAALLAATAYKNLPEKEGHNSNTKAGISGTLNSTSEDRKTPGVVNPVRFNFAYNTFKPKEREGVTYDVKLTEKSTRPRFEHNYSHWAGVQDLLNQEIEKNYWENVLEKVNRYETLLVVSKRYNIFWLFKDRRLVRTGPAGVGNESTGKITPTGDFKIHRKETEWHTSGEFEGADMGWAVYFSGNGLSKYRGIAVHSSGSRHRLTSGGGMFKIGDSNGCVNVRRDDARLISKTLSASTDHVVVMD